MKLQKPIYVAGNKSKYERYIPSKRLIERSNVFVVETKDSYVTLKNRDAVNITEIEFDKLNKSMYSSWEDWENYKPQEHGFNICFDISDRM